jgi:hypothetical protein
VWEEEQTGLPEAHPLFPLPHPLFLAPGRGEESGEEEEEQGRWWEQMTWEQKRVGWMVFLSI